MNFKMDKGVLLRWVLTSVFEIVQPHVQEERDTMGWKHLRKPAGSHTAKLHSC
jgi:hypothetical protein